MKLIVLHGEDTQKSYQRLRKFTEEAKNRNWEILYDIISETNSLFGKERLIVLRDYKIFTKKPFNGTLVIYHEGILPLTFLKTLPKDSKIEEFKLPKLIWAFLDNIYPGNSQKVIQEFHQIVVSEAPEFVFSLIANLFRDLFWVKVDSLSMSYPSWRVSKLKSQCSKFTKEQIINFIESLAKIDIDVKTGRADLVSELDLLIIRKLQ